MHLIILIIYAAVAAVCVCGVAAYARVERLRGWDWGWATVCVVLWPLAASLVVLLACYSIGEEVLAGRRRSIFEDD